MSTTISQINQMVDNTPVMMFEGTIQYVNDVKQGQYGSQQSLKVSQGSESIYVQFDKAPVFDQSYKGRQIRVECSVTGKGPVGVKKSSYFSKNANSTVHLLKVSTDAKLTFDGGGQPYTPPPPGHPSQSPTTTTYQAPPQQGPRPITDEMLFPYLDRWVETYARVCERVGEKVPPEHLAALTTHMVMNFR